MLNLTLKVKRCIHVFSFPDVIYFEQSISQFFDEIYLNNELDTFPLED